VKSIEKELNMKSSYMNSSVGFSVLGLIVNAALETVWYWDPKSEEDYDETIESMNFE